MAKFVHMFNFSFQVQVITQMVDNIKKIKTKIWPTEFNHVTEGFTISLLTYYTSSLPTELKSVNGIIAYTFNYSIHVQVITQMVDNIKEMINKKSDLPNSNQWPKDLLRVYWPTTVIRSTNWAKVGKWQNLFICLIFLFKSK